MLKKLDVMSPENRNVDRQFKNYYAESRMFRTFGWGFIAFVFILMSEGDVLRGSLGVLVCSIIALVTWKVMTSSVRLEERRIAMLQSSANDHGD